MSAAAQLLQARCRLPTPAANCCDQREPRGPRSTIAALAGLFCDLSFHARGTLLPLAPTPTHPPAGVVESSLLGSPLACTMAEEGGAAGGAGGSAMVRFSRAALPHPLSTDTTHAHARSLARARAGGGHLHPHVRGRHAPAARARLRVQFLLPARHAALPPLLLCAAAAARRGVWVRCVALRCASFEPHPQRRRTCHSCHAPTHARCSVQFHHFVSLSSWLLGLSKRHFAVEKVRGTWRCRLWFAARVAADIPPPPPPLQQMRRWKTPPPCSRAWLPS